MSKPNVVYIVSRLESGGIEWIVLDFIRLYQSKVGNIHIWQDGNSSGSLAPEAENLGAIVHHVPKSASGLLQFSKFLKKEKIHVVHANTGYPSALYLRVAKRAGVPVRIGHWHSVQFPQKRKLKERIVQRLQAIMAKSSTNVWSVSKSVKNSLKNSSLRSKTQILYNGYDFSPSEDKSGSLVSIIHVGRFNAVKNHPLIWKILDTLHIPFEFTGCGRHDDPDLLPTKERLKRWEDKGGNVRLPGNCEDLDTIFKEHRVFLFTSLTEGLSGALVQAASAGLHCVVSDIPAHREVADFFDNVHVVDLKAPLATWVEKIENAPEKKDTQKAFESFQTSPFRHEIAFATWLQAYGA